MSGEQTKPQWVCVYESTWGYSSLIYIMKARSFPTPSSSSPSSSPLSLGLTARLLLCILEHNPVSPALVYKKSVLGKYISGKDPTTGIIQSKKAMSLCISPQLWSKEQKTCVPRAPAGKAGTLHGKMRSCCQQGWLQGAGQDRTRGCENLRGDLQRPGRGRGKPCPVFMHSCVINGMNSHFLDHAQPGSQDSEGGNTNNVTFELLSCRVYAAKSWKLLRSVLTAARAQHFGSDVPPVTLASSLPILLVSVPLLFCFSPSSISGWVSGATSTGCLTFPPELRLRLRRLIPSIPSHQELDL